VYIVLLRVYYFSCRIAG